MQPVPNAALNQNKPQILRSFFSKVPGTRLDEQQSESFQSLVRIAILACIMAYTAISSYFVSSDGGIEPWAATVLIYFACYAPSAFAIAVLVRRFPGHYPARRMFAMLNDYAAISFAIIVGCKAMLPLYAIIVWLAVGNGVRFGWFYLNSATIMSQLSLAAIFLLTPYWQADVALVATLSLTALVVPFYAGALLRNLDSARQKAEDSSLAKSRFLAQASHDLRQPVHAIGLFVVSLRQTGLSEAQRGIVERIDRSLQGVARLFRSLLDVATLDSGSLETRIEPFRLGALLQEIAQENLKTAGWADVDLKVVDTSLAVSSDRVLLTTMVQNLVSNAIKYSDGNRILIGCRRRNGMATIQVVDQGKGVAEEHLPHIFDEFYQVRDRGDADRQGVGLGLSIVNRIASAIELKVELRSVVGCGTSVSICDLPIWNGAITETDEDVGTAFDSPLQGMRILLVEDDIDVLEGTQELLSSWGCIVSPCSNIPESIEPCDLLITDFDLGDGKTGADCIAAVRSMAGRLVPCIVTTGHDAGRISSEVADAAVPVLKKPLQAAELRSAIGAVRIRIQTGRIDMS